MHLLMKHIDSNIKSPDCCHAPRRVHDRMELKDTRTAARRLLWGFARSLSVTVGVDLCTELK